MFLASSSALRTVWLRAVLATPLLILMLPGHGLGH